MFSNHAIKIECNEKPSMIEIKNRNLKLMIDMKIVDIEIQNIESIQTKDVDKQSYAFLLRMKCEEAYVLGFNNINIRDFFKIYIFFEQKKISESLTKGISGFNVDVCVDLNVLENTKTSLVLFISHNPVLLSVYNDMNTTISEFYKYLKSSYYCSIKNEKNVIDRLLNEKLRSYGIKEDNYATRLNTHSFMSIDTTTKCELIEASAQKTVSFTPIYQSEIEIKTEKLNNWEVPMKIEPIWNIPIESEIIQPKKNYDKKILQNMFQENKEIYEAQKNNENIKDKIKDFQEQYKLQLVNKELSGFDPARFAL